MDSPRAVDAGASPPLGSLLDAPARRSVDNLSLEAAPVPKQTTQSSDGPDDDAGFEEFDGGEEDADLAVLEILEVELEVGESEEQDDTDTGQAQDIGRDLVDLLETRLREDGRGAEEAGRVAKQMMQIRTKRDEWESVRANTEAANAAYDKILKEFAERKREIEGSGVEVKTGPMPPGNPLAAFILDFLYWPHDKVSHDVGYLDTSIPTYRNLGQYGFYDTLRSGQSSVMETHLCQAHSSSKDSPTFPRDGVFSCDEAVQELCLWFSQTVYQTRLNLRVPGLIFGYGAYNKKYLDGLRADVPTISSTTLHRSVKPLERDAGVVAPRSFPFTVISGAEAGSPPFSFEWDVDHPSSCAYAGSHGGIKGALEGRSYALTLDRALEEKVFLANLPQAPKKSFFQRMAYVIYEARISGEGNAYSVGADWGQKINNAYRTEQQERARLALTDPDAADAWGGFSADDLKTTLDNFGLVKSVKCKAESYDSRIEEFSALAAFHRVPRARSLLEKALWETRWDTQLKRRKSRPLRGAESETLIVQIAPFGYPLAVTGNAAIRDGLNASYEAPRPAHADGLECLVLASSTPMGMPLATLGTIASARQRIDLRSGSHPYNARDGADAASNVVPMMPAGPPLAMTGEFSRAIQWSRTKLQGLPFDAAESGRVVVGGTPFGLPLALNSLQKQFKGNDTTQPFPALEANLVVVHSAPIGPPLGKNSGTARQHVSFSGADKSRPVRSAEAPSIVSTTTPLGPPLAQRGSSAYASVLKGIDKDRTPPVRAQEASAVVLSHTPMGAPLAVATRVAAVDKSVAVAAVSRPIDPPEAASAVITTTTAGIPVGVNGNHETGQGKESGAANAGSVQEVVANLEQWRPMQGDEGVGAVVTTTPTGVPIAQRGGLGGRPSTSTASSGGSGSGGQARGRGRGRGRGGLGESEAQD